MPTLSRYYMDLHALKVRARKQSRARQLTRLAVGGLLLAVVCYCALVLAFSLGGM